MKLKVIVLVLLGLVTTLAACEQGGEETPTETTSPTETVSPAETPTETTTPAETPATDATPVETPTPSPS